MNLENTLLAALYAGGIILVAVVYLRTVLNPRKQHRPVPSSSRPKASSGEPVASPGDLPGSIFLDLKEIYDLLADPKNPQASRATAIRKAQDKLGSISEGLVEFLAKDGHNSLSYDPKDTLIVQNVAVCLYTFLEQIKNERRRTTLEPTYPKAIWRLARAINGYFQHDFGRERFILDLISCKERIYLSLYRNSEWNEEVTAKFVADFAPPQPRLRTKEEVAAYLLQLESCWLHQECELRKVNPKYIIPLFTVRNILRHCERNFENDTSAHAVDRISNYLADGSFKQLCFMGLTYNPKMVADTYGEIFRTLDRIAAV